MKRMISLTFILTFTHIYSQTIQPSQIQNSLICMSPGRGGTHLLRLVLQQYTKRPFYRILTKPSRPFALKPVQILDIVPSKNKRPFYHTHCGEKCQLIDPTTNQLVLITRNPKELMVSRAKRAIAKKQLSLCQDEVKIFITNFILDKANYKRPMAQLQAFDTWPESKRYQITYEDLLFDQQNSIEKLMTFLGEDPKIVEPGLKKLEQLQKQSIMLYNQTCKRTGGSLSSGIAAIFHSKDLSKETRLAVDALLQTNYPRLWKKYLSRYKEDS